MARYAFTINEKPIPKACKEFLRLHYGIKDFTGNVVDIYDAATAESFRFLIVGALYDVDLTIDGKPVSLKQPLV